MRAELEQNGTNGTFLRVVSIQIFALQEVSGPISDRLAIGCEQTWFCLHQTTSDPSCLGQK